MLALPLQTHSHTSGEYLLRTPTDVAPNKKWKKVAFIVSNASTSSAQCTLKKKREICKFFEDVKYRVYREKDLTYEQFKEYLTVAYQRNSLSCTRFVVHFTGYGSNRNISMQDGKDVKIKDVQKLLFDLLPKSTAKILLIDVFHHPLTSKEKLCNLWSHCWSYLWCLITRCDNKIKCSPDSNELVAYATTNDSAVYSFSYGGFWTHKLINKLYELKDKDIWTVVTAVNDEFENEEQPNIGGYQQPERASSLKEDVYLWSETSKLLVLLIFLHFNDCMQFNLVH